jgi:hypothetical protein
VAEFGNLAEWFTFVSDRFDQSSELPVEYNAGYRFYGRDVATFLSDGLAARGFTADVVGEDWGWLVGAHAQEDERIQIAVYPNPSGESGPSGEWALMVRRLERRRRLGFLPVAAEREVDDQTTTAIADVFRDASIELHRTGPGGVPLSP